MKVWVIALAVLLPLVGAAAQEDTTIQLHCRALASGEVLNTDETLVNGMACRQVRQSPPKATSIAEPPSALPANKQPADAPKSVTPSVDARKDLAPAQRTDSRQCLILKRMGPADQITSHMYSFGIRGKQFQYVEGDFPPGLKFHGRLTDHDVRNIQNHNGRVVIMEPKYNADDLREAKQSCKQQ